MAERMTYNWHICNNDYNFHNTLILPNQSFNTLPLHIAVICRDPKGPFPQKEIQWQINGDIQLESSQNSITITEAISNRLLIEMVSDWPGELCLLHPHAPPWWPPHPICSKPEALSHKFKNYKTRKTKQMVSASTYCVCHPPRPPHPLIFLSWYSHLCVASFHDVSIDTVCEWETVTNRKWKWGTKKNCWTLKVNGFPSQLLHLG